VIDRVEAPEFDLQTHMRSIWRYKTYIAFLVFGMVVASLIISLSQTALYQGEVKVFVQRAKIEGLSGAGSSGSDDLARAVRDEMEVLRSPAIQTLVRDEFGPVPKPDVSQIAETDYVRVRATSTERSRAAAVAKAYGMRYIDSRQVQHLNDVNASARGVQAKIDVLQAEIDTLNRQMNDLVAQQAAARASNPNAFVSSEPLGGLSAQRSQLLSQQGELKQRLDSLQLDAPLPSSGPQLVTTGTVPTIKLKPRPVQAGVLGGVLGLLVGVGLALFLAYLDDRIHSKEDLERLIGDVPVLGLIPVLPPTKAAERSSIVSVIDPDSVGAEAFRNLSTFLQFIGVERQPKVLQITSPNAEDGKSTTVGNLAAVLAAGGQRVVVVDCDLRRGRLHQLFGVANAAGFTGVYQRVATLCDAVRPVPGVGLDLLPSGALPHNPAALLLGKRTAEVLNELQERYDVVLVDCPPVLPVADAVALSAWVDGTILVVAADTTTRRDLRRTLEVLRHANTPLIGAVLNRTSADTHYGYPYGYARQEGGSGRRDSGGSSRDEDMQAAVRTEPIEEARRPGPEPSDALAPDPGPRPRALRRKAG
ncbi:MAG: polysaccharide biosynthesis tyrosine autokinase, partial [Actinomycetota bacterium]|nr:polysaccharide biosynthesis tyrosine autokinase [Actinomycetota bacterium]